MKKEKIIYNKSKEATRILLFPGLFLAVLSLGMQAFCVLNKIYEKDLTLFMILILVPAVVQYIVTLWFIKIRRFNLEIDFENEILSFCGGFYMPKQYDLKEITINKRLKVQSSSYEDNIYEVDIIYQNMIICTVDSKKFEIKTGCKIDEIIINNEF